MEPKIRPIFWNNVDDIDCVTMVRKLNEVIKYINEQG